MTWYFGTSTFLVWNIGSQPDTNQTRGVQFVMQMLWDNSRTKELVCTKVHHLIPVINIFGAAYNRSWGGGSTLPIFQDIPNQCDNDCGFSCQPSNSCIIAVFI